MSELLVLYKSKYGSTKNTCSGFRKKPDVMCSLWKNIKKVIFPGTAR